MVVKVWLIGAPMDDTESFRPGTRFAPQKIREIIPFVEYATPLGEAPIDMLEDLGDVDLLIGRVEENLARIERRVAEVGTPVIVVGGEHTVTLATIRALRPRTYVHIDAHLDMRGEWPRGQSLSHATWLRRAVEETGIHVIAVGVHAYAEEEAEYAKSVDAVVIHRKATNPRTIMDALSTATPPIHVAVDIDVLDPAYAPGVGNPEPGGLTWDELEHVLLATFLYAKPRSLDVVEYSPPYDCGGVTATRAVAVITRFLLGLAPLLK